MQFPLSLNVSLFLFTEFQAATGQGKEPLWGQQSYSLGHLPLLKEKIYF